MDNECIWPDRINLGRGMVKQKQYVKVWQLPGWEGHSLGISEWSALGLAVGNLLTM